MSYFPVSHTHGKNKLEVELDFYNYAKNSELKNVAVVDTSDFAETYVGELDIDKSKNVAKGLSSMKSKIDKLNVLKFVSVPVDLIKDDVVKKTEYDELDKKSNTIDNSRFVKKDRL